MQFTKFSACFAMKAGIRYRFHHAGIPTTDRHPNERYSAPAGMFTADHPGRFRTQWHRFEAGSPLHPLIRTLPHVAFQVDDLAAAIAGEDILPGPFEPIDGFRVAVINDAGVPVELIETSLPDAVVWERAEAGHGSLYRDELQ